MTTSPLISKAEAEILASTDLTREQSPAQTLIDPPTTDLGCVTDELKIKRGDFYRNKTILAPMVRTGTLPMRLTCLDYGADLVYSPELVDKSIIDSERIWNEQFKTFDYMRKGKLIFRTIPREKPNLVLQLGTADPALALQAALAVYYSLPDVSAIDVNCGCPKKFSVAGGMGAALLSDPDRLVKILTNLVQNLPVPVSCKIRILNTPEATLDLCKKIESTGVHALAVHCRTRDERPLDPAHWDALKEIVKEVTTIPIIANGDIFRPKDVIKIKDLTGVSSVMIARGAMINPSIFSKLELVPQSETVAKYIRYSVEHGIIYQNAKYTLMQMYDDPKTPEFSGLQKAKSLKDICSVFGIEDCLKPTQSNNTNIDKIELTPELLKSTKHPLEDEVSVSDSKKSKID